MTKKPEKKQQSPTGPIYQLKITLIGARPPIWRRVLVPAEYSLAQLHAIIQIAMGWTNSHLHQFEIGKDRGTIFVSDPRFELDGGYFTDIAVLKKSLKEIGFDTELLSTLDLNDPDVLDERKVALESVLNVEKAKFKYEYDFGDSWWHEILLEKILAPEAGITYPVCIAGKRSGPPDDCGGVWGYMGMLEALKHPDDPENEELLEWLGEGFDPVAFDPATVNPGFKNIRRVLSWSPF